MDNVLIRSAVGIPVWFTIMGWLITIVNVIANSVLIFIVRKNFLDSSHHWLIFSLATADLLIGVSIFPSIFFCNISGSKCDWHIQLFAYSSLIYISVSSVATTIFGHYIIIAFPLKYAAIMTSSRIWKIILLSWVIPLFLGLLPLIWEHQNSDTFLQVTEKYFAGLLVLFEVVPFCVFLWISIHLFIIIRSQKNKIQVQCNVHGRLSPHLERTDKLENDLNTENSCEVTDLSKRIDVFLVCNARTRQETSNELRQDTSQISTRDTVANKQDEGTAQFPRRSSYLYSLNNWLPSIPRRVSSETRTSIDVSEFTSSFSLPNAKDILNRIRIRQLRDQRRRSRLITCLLIVFMVCYALTFANASCLFSKQCHSFVTSTNFKIATLFFELLNSALNPILFMTLGKDLRRKVMKLLTCKRLF